MSFTGSIHPPMMRSRCFPGIWSHSSPPGNALSRPAGFRARIRTTMTNSRWLTAIIEREGDGYVSLCPELDVASQGDSIEEARANLIEALTLFFESADSSEIGRRLHPEILVTQVEVPVG